MPSPTEPRPPSLPAARPDAQRSRLGGALVGAAVMAGVDEIVFHQLLGWHHFYDRATTAVGLASDGLLHAAELLALVAGGFMLAELWRSQVLAPAFVRAGLLLGLGGFQLFDGLINHKALQLHQVRYGVPALPYDLAWNLAALALLLLGAARHRQATRAARRP